VTTFLATHVVSVYDGQSEKDIYGDDNGYGLLMARHVLASLVERSDITGTATNSEVSSVRNITGRLPATCPIEEGWRIQDERTGAWYLVDHVVRQEHPAGTMPTAIRCRRVR
jgi:hypothetical protein